VARGLAVRGRGRDLAASRPALREASRRDAEGLSAGDARRVFVTGGTGYLGQPLICELIAASGIPATIIKPWYVLGPGHRWPGVLQPVYWIMERLPRTRDAALRLGLVTLAQMTAALVLAVENPAAGVRFAGVPEIRDSAGQLRPA
jgi:hypothetical protein